MQQVSMNDGLDSRETIAFGLGAAEVAALVLALLTAYAVVRSGLPAAVGWPLAALVACGGAALAWGRLAGRPLLEWAVLLAAFAARTCPARASRVRARANRWSAALRAAVADAGLRMRPRAGGVAPGQAGAVVIPLALRRPPAMTIPRAVAPLRAKAAGSHVVAFFSLAGGSGRTTLAVEVAAVLAARGRAAAASGGRGNRVALVDLARRNPAVGLRLGLSPPPGSSDVFTTHPSGLLVAVAPPSAAPGEVAPAFPSALVEEAQADVVVVDVDCDLSEHCREILARCDQVLVTSTPTAAGVADAYRSTAVLRGLGLRERVGHVVNRWRPGVELDEVMTDLGGEILAAIPEDHAFVAAEDCHRLACLEAGGEVGAALDRLATRIEERAGRRGRAATVPQSRTHAG